MLTTRRGSGFRRATGSDEEEEVGAVGSGKQRGPARGGCGCWRQLGKAATEVAAVDAIVGGKKMRRARLEATTAAREDGCSLRLHDGEEE
ncbi:hypothetical protein BHE74_00040909 [Ensete ventricosum]|nr:hypothetical protein BHE74_00040909 [Ensete ventricosum]RZS12094.1 hypothetical protein BHM03_00043482 [Ensete ventricosum]